MVLCLLQLQANVALKVRVGVASRNVQGGEKAYYFLYGK